LPQQSHQRNPQNAKHRILDAIIHHISILRAHIILCVTAINTLHHRSRSDIGARKLITAMYALMSFKASHCPTCQHVRYRASANEASCTSRDQATHQHVRYRASANEASCTSRDQATHQHVRCRIYINAIFARIAPTRLLFNGRLNISTWMCSMQQMANSHMDISHMDVFYAANDQ
jgi:hypothetical protein